jgi:hypothetical protein
LTMALLIIKVFSWRKKIKMHSKINRWSVNCLAWLWRLGAPIMYKEWLGLTKISEQTESEWAPDDCRSTDWHFTRL